MNSLQPLNMPALVAQPVLDPSVDYYQLRREGIGHVQQAGHQQWTDYNIHDPGITILEALCYAITDVGYRIEWDIEDIPRPRCRPPIRCGRIRTRPSSPRAKC